MFDTLQRVFVKRFSSFLETLSRDAAEQSIAEIRSRLDDRVLDMSRAEARGYLRERGRRVVDRHVRLILRERKYLRDWAVAAIGHRALELVVQQLARERLSASPARPVGQLRA